MKFARKCNLKNINIKIMSNTKSLPMLRIAAIAGFTAVAIGAMGAHALKPYLSEYQIAIFEKGVHYHFYHTLAILAVAVMQKIAGDDNRLKWAGLLFLGGIICFSGSLYLLACRDLLTFPVGWAGPVTPLGGLLFMAGWVMVFLSAKK